MRILVAEDDPIQAGAIKMYLRKINFELVALCDNASDLFKIAQKQAADLVLIDIFLRGEEDGIQLAKRIRNARIPLAIILLTATRDEAVLSRARTFVPESFLVKPFDQITLQNAIELAVVRNAKRLDQEKSAHPVDHIYIKAGTSLKKVYTKDILYVTVDRKYSTIRTQQANFVVRMSLQEVANELSTDHFLQVHRGYLVNLKAIEEVSLVEQLLRMKDKSEVPFSKTYRSELVAKLKPLQ